jgi:hypothetical protein
MITTRSAAFLLFLLPLLPAGALAQTQDQTQTETKAPPTPEAKAAWQKLRAACAGDFQKFCSQIERGKGARGAVRACMQAHETELSPACRDARAERAAARAKGKS